MRQENRANGADEPPSKKRKIAQKFRYGSILSLNFTNFMTFTHAALNPGPHLNLITGPNGSGKSSFFCALFLVLGGSPKLIGRSPSARDFIQHSKDTATIEVELCTPQGTVRLKRVILLNESKWFINNVPKTEGEVHKVVARNNIILDNLTQFLPQDRVKAFATLSPVELLQKTEEAILDPAVVQLHDQLIGIGADLAKSLREQQDTKQVLEVLSAQNKAALKEVERHRHKQQLLRKREECLLAIPFFEFARKQKQGSALNTKVEEAKNALSVEQEKEEKTQSQDLDLKRKKLDFKIQQTAYAKKKFEDQRETLQTTFEKVTHETEGLLEEESLLEERRVQRERGLQQATAELKALETAVVASVPLSQLEESVREKAEEVRQLGEQYERILDQLGHQRKRVAATHAELNQTTELLNRASSVHSTRLGVTWQTTPNCVEVWHWIEAHRALLIGNVYLVALELEVSTGDPLHAKYLEAAIPRWLMDSFERDRVQELHRVFQEEAKHKQTRLNDCRKKAATLEAEYTQLKADLMHLRRQALEKRAEYEKRWDVSTDQSIAILKALPDNVEKLQADARAAQLEAEAIYADPAVLIEYTNRANQIRQLSARLDTLVCEHEALARKLATSKERWLTPLTQAIQELNLKFQSRCEAQGITGVIELDYKDESNFGTYGIELSCSFRAGEAMHRLDPYRQSGGERSVVTILYLLALQSLNQCPLRVVDEIDQGMDASNQRKVFYQMLDACAEPDTPQSFLITPKLLPDMIPSNALNWTCL
eukprot:NODE_237_length_2621_cov_95.565758_g68_i1.p1 GENE.NODE_237_length_2621_cov_95.565758_g68_i1~~NODE_237_length_2621_cov_95.565758_g68_i1.p1  ORF type:complete len:771 (+),score=239.22 NODE_237_length_2621_cov_95.565758_g68_i1:85-2397(+)